MDSRLLVESNSVTLNDIGDIIIGEGRFMKIVERVFGAKEHDTMLDILSQTYGEVNLFDDTFYRFYAQENGLTILDWTITGRYFIFGINKRNFEDSLKKTNRELYNAINEEIENNM